MAKSIFDPRPDRATDLEAPWGSCAGEDPIQPGELTPEDEDDHGDDEFDGDDGYQQQ